ncbi:MAG: ATPase, T2SS/T4P/T4SS family, partial [Marmoricola sp.]
MSSLSERLAALNRTTGQDAASGQGTEEGTTTAPKRRADVPPDTPPSHENTPARSHTSLQGTHAGSPPAATPGAGQGTVPSTGQDRSGPGQTSGLGQAVGASSGSQARAAATTSSRSSEAAKDRFEDLKEHVHTELLQQLGPQLYDANLDAEELAGKVRTVLADVLAATNRPLTRADRDRITRDIADDILGYGPLEPYLRDNDVAEVMVNGPFDIWLERKGKLVKVDGKFKDEAHLRRTIDKIVSRIGRRVDESSPMVDARLPDGSRVNAVVPPLAIDGSTLTIRKFSADPLTVNDLIRFGSMSDRTADFLDACVRGRLNVVVSGGTGSGKTTTLNVLSSFIPTDERIVTIEDAKELQLHQDHVLAMEARPPNIEGRGEVTIRDLVKNSLRMRPDRIVIGECRSGEALDMLQAMNTGHDGPLTTLHSNSPRDALSRLETLVLMAGFDLPVRAIREQVSSAVDLIVQLSRLRDGTRRVTHISEVQGMEGDVITLQDIFMFDFLKACVEARLNVFVSGGTGSGKTTTLNVLSSFIPEDERIITIEDAAELQLRQDHVLTLEARPANLEGEGEVTIRDLLRNSLHMRPDRIIVGECRSGEA